MTLREQIEVLEALGGNEGFVALMTAVKRMQDVAFSKITHESTGEVARSVAAAQWRAFEELLTLRARTIEALQAELEREAEDGR